MYDDTLNVWTNGHHVGYLWRDERNVMGFQYSEEWLENPVRFPVSRTLPLQVDPYEPGTENSVAHNYFANLLPEADSRKRICREKKISLENDFELLRAIGGECAGALSVLGDEPQDEISQYRLLNDDELTELLNTRNPAIVVGGGSSPPRLSLAGAQDKAPVKYDAGKIYIPLNNSISTHILKYQLRDVSHVPAYETITTWIAQELGLGACDIDYHTHADNSYALIERYDRIFVDGQLIRLHQEDFCQASGRSSHNKYEHEGGPSFAECVKLVQEHSSQPLKDIPRLIRWQVFNYLVGNSDAHAKNLSFVYGIDHTTQLAPFYDLIAIHAWPSNIFNHELAMTVGGENNVSHIKLEHWKKLAEECEIPFASFENAIKQLSEEIIDAFDRSQNRFEDLHGEYPAFQQVRKALLKNQRLLQRR
jgi:serine/threonine-protein kinase HipA